MRLNRRGAEDVLHVDRPCHERIRQQHAVTLPPHGFRAHHRHSSTVTKRQQLVNRCGELRRLHVIGIAAERLVLPGAVCGIGAWLSEAAEILEMPVLNAFSGETSRQSIAAEMRMPARLWNRADVGQPIDLLRAQQRDELVSGSCGVADCPDAAGGHRSVCLQRRSRERARVQP